MGIGRGIWTGSAHSFSVKVTFVEGGRFARGGSHLTVNQAERGEGCSRQKEEHEQSPEAAGRE